MNDLTWMLGLGEGHHGRVCDEFYAGTVLIAHHGVLEFVDYPWIERKSGAFLQIPSMEFALRAILRMFKSFP